MRTISSDTCRLAQSRDRLDVRHCADPDRVSREETDRGTTAEGHGRMRRMGKANDGCGSRGARGGSSAVCSASACRAAGR